VRGRPAGGVDLPSSAITSITSLSERTMSPAQCRTSTHVLAATHDSFGHRR
jgi:hypothetical protein